MDLSLSEDDEFLAETVRSFVTRHAKTEDLVALQRTEPGFDPAWTAAMAEAGWLGVLVPETFGGVGATALQAAVIAEELGRGPVPGPFLASSVISSLLLAAGESGEARDGLLEAIAAGDAVVVPALTPEGVSWNGLRSDAEFTGEQEGTVTATFSFVPYAESATHLLVPVRRDDEGVEFGIVPAGAGGVRTRVLGGFLAHNSEVVLDAAPVSAVVRASSASVEHALAWAYVTIAAYEVGGGQVLLERCVDYSQSRHQFGVPIGKFQRVQDHIVELVNALDAARWMLYEALWKLDNGLDGAFAGAHRAKAVAAEAYVTCADAAHKVHGGIGVDPDFGVTLFTQQSRSLFDVLGGPRWHKRRMIDALEWAA